MTQEHPITPPPELIRKWNVDAVDAPIADKRYIATQAARWGADQQLLACGKYLEQCAAWEEEDVTEMYNYLRPKPPSLKQQAMDVLKRSCFVNPVHENIIRRALEQLDD